MAISLPLVSEPLADTFGRRVEYLRISLTDRCNLRCVYCMPENGVPYEDPAHLLTFDEVARVVAALAPAGLRKIRLTGGEPLVRKNVPELAERLVNIPEIREVTLTTNAILLARDASALFSAGMRRLNISLDSLKPERFARMARRDEFTRAWNGIETALAAGFSPIKLNCVVIRGENDDEILDFARLTQRLPVSVRFLEYMPIGQVNEHQWRAGYVSNDEVIATLQSAFPDLVSEGDSPESTSRNFTIPGALGTVGVINPISHKFCAGCNRLRLTADGRLVPCLADNFEYDLKTPLRAGAEGDEIRAHTRAALFQKPLQSDFEGRLARGGSRRIMAQIGG